MTEIDLLLTVLPPDFRDDIETEGLTEIVLDLGRPLEYRHVTGSTRIIDALVDDEMLRDALKDISTFGPDNRAGIEGTLHRISRIVDRFGSMVGLTCRVGRTIPDASKIIDDLLKANHNILLLGSPGAGKTTILRDIAYKLSQNRRVVIVDTSNEIAGEGRVPHEAVGLSRRMQVPLNRNQADVMIEAVENHTPEIIIVDEISTNAETQACRTISQRGVQLMATAHGKTLADLIKNPPLVKLLGGIQSVTLSDEQANQRGTNKTVLEREALPIFTAVVEIEAFDRVNVYTRIADAVDASLTGGTCKPEKRVLTRDGRIVVQQMEECAKSATCDIERKYEDTSYVIPIVKKKGK